MGKLIIDGNSVYEIDEECLKKRKISPACGIEQALKKQAEREKKEKEQKWKRGPIVRSSFWLDMFSRCFRSHHNHRRSFRITEGEW